MVAPLLVGPALWGAGAISAMGKAAAATAGLTALGTGMVMTAPSRRQPPQRPSGRSWAQNNPYALGPAYGGDQQNFPLGRGRVGGGNAGPSVESPRLTPVVQPASNTTASVLPGSRNVTIVNGPERARNAAVSAAAQQAGLPAWNWQADENRSVRQAAMSAGEAAAALRSAGQALPAAANANRPEYWQAGGRGSLADMQAWAAANPALAARLKQRSGYGTASVVPALNSADEAILTAQGAGALGGLGPGATADDALLAGQAAGVFGEQRLDGTGDDAVFYTADDGSTYWGRTGQIGGTPLDPTTRVASAQAAAPTTNALPQSQDLAQENLRQYLEAIKRGGMTLG